MAHAASLPDTRRGLVVIAGALLGLAIALATTVLSWQTGAAVLGLGLAALVGLAQTCSA